MSATWCDVLVQFRVYVGPKPIGVNGGGAAEYRERGAGGNELSGPRGCQLSNRHAIARDEKRLAAIKAAHDVAARVTELALSD